MTDEEKKEQDRISKVLAEISANAPKLLLKNVAVEKKMTPTMEMVMKKAVGLKSISAEKREQIKNLLDAGEFSKTVVVEDPAIAKKLDNYYTRAINKAIKEGKLPPRITKKDLKK